MRKVRIKGTDIYVKCIDVGVSYTGYKGLECEYLNGPRKGSKTIISGDCLVEEYEEEKTNSFTKEEKDAIIHGLIGECKEYIHHGLNGFNKEGKEKYNTTLSLLIKFDKEKNYQYVYKDWKFVDCNDE